MLILSDTDGELYGPSQGVSLMIRRARQQRAERHAPLTDGADRGPMRHAIDAGGAAAVVEERLRAACRRAGRARGDVTLVAVTKTVSAEVAGLAAGAGRAAIWARAGRKNCGARPPSCRAGALAPHRPSATQQDRAHAAAGRPHSFRGQPASAGSPGERRAAGARRRTCCWK